MSAPDRPLVLSCEHGGNRVPARYAHLFRGQAALLRTHRGWDPGALDVARNLSRTLGAPLVAATTTRLLIDLNRSSHNPAIFSAYARKLSKEDRAVLIEEIHTPHWARVRGALVAAIAAADPPVLHLAVHSFTPRLGRQVRGFDLGILYDPARAAERRFARAWRASFGEQAPRLRVRSNAPYRGNADGLTTAMRREHPDRRGAVYLGIELELNQNLLRTSKQRSRIAEIVKRSLCEALDRS